MQESEVAYIQDIEKLPKLEIRDTFKYGRGVFAAENIEKGRVIRILAGEIISTTECLKRIILRRLKSDDPLQIEDDRFIVPDKISRYFNHSCQPNAGLRKISELFALREIKTGEEITFDYSSTVSGHSFWHMSCKCGEENCREKIGNVLTLPPKVLDNYAAEGALQDYMQRHLTTVQNSCSYWRVAKKLMGRLFLRRSEKRV